MRAADLFEQGVIPAEIARQVGVSHQIVSDWRTVWRRYGRDGLHGAGRAGRRPKLGAEQLDQVEAALANGPEANGYTTNLWTLRRVAEVIEQVSGWPTTQRMCGTCCGNSWAGPGNGQRGEPSNATMRLSSAGSSNAGRR